MDNNGHPSDDNIKWFQQTYSTQTEPSIFFWQIIPNRILEEFFLFDLVNIMQFLLARTIFN